MGNRLFLYFLFSNYGDGNYFVLKKREGWHWPGSQFVPEDEVEVVEVSAMTVVTIATASTDVMLGCGMQSNTNINTITQQLEFEVVTGQDMKCPSTEEEGRWRGGGGESQILSTDCRDCSSQTSHCRNH